MACVRIIDAFMRLFTTLLAIAAYVQAPVFGDQSSKPSYAQSLLDARNLPKMRVFDVVGSFSSYDRTGSNDDGNSRRFLRHENGGLVMAEAKGPGAITRIWTPTPIDAPIDFYFDGEAQPRLSLPFSKLFSGDTPPFTGILTGHGAGGYYSYVPLEFHKSIKVVIRSLDLKYYTINYVIHKRRLPTLNPMSAESIGFSLAAPEGEEVLQDQMLSPGKTITVFESKRGGRVESLEVGPASAFVGNDRAIVIRMYWEDENRPAVELPVGDLFGYSFGTPATHSLLVGTENDWNYIRFPMPFSRSAKIEITSEQVAGEPLRIRTRLFVSSRERSEDEGTFHAAWHRELPTVKGKPFTYLSTTGSGHVVASFLQAQGLEPGDTEFLEGDDEIALDGKLTIHGTGSEDSFNGGFYGVPGRWNQRESFPFSGCLDYDKSTARTGGYRIFMADAYVFHHKIDYTIEHGAKDNDIPADYVGTTFYYLDRPGGPETSLVDVSLRAVNPPDGFEVTFFPSPPPIAALTRASYELRAIQTDGTWTTYASIAPNDSGLQAFPTDLQPVNFHLPGRLAAAGNQASFDSFIGPPLIAFTVNVPRAGLYAISIDGISGPAGAKLQLRQNDEPLGSQIDFYSKVPGFLKGQKMADLRLTEGVNLLYLTLPERNAMATSDAHVEITAIRGKLVHALTNGR